ncbi:MAG: hypothetical protein GYA36_22495, partial [Veillonellaceae bacterium]|nr:hypothetical protein [Veillonellaceae bacterium]
DPYPWFSQQEGQTDEYNLFFEYPYAVIPLEINIYLTHPSSDNFSISVANKLDKLSEQVYSGEIPFNGDCPSIFTLPLTTAYPVDHITLRLSDPENPVQISSIELVGILPYAEEIQPAWRIAIPADDLTASDSHFPGGMTIDGDHNIYLANGQNGLLKLNQDGELISTYLSNETHIYSDVFIDQFSNILVTDVLTKEFIALSKNGTLNTSGGMDFSIYSPRAVAVSPFNGNVYLLDVGDIVNRIQVYTSDTGEYLHEIELEPAEYPSYKGLVFDSDGFLYTLDSRKGSIIKINVDEKMVVSEIAQKYLHNVGIMDLAIDGVGNYYILLSNSPENIAVYILDGNGEMVKRFGDLSYDGSPTEQGTFSFPVSIAVSSDGNLMTICENGYLTAYRFGK